MPCYHPMIRVENTYEWEKAADGHRYHPAKIEYPDDLYNRLEELKRQDFKYRYQIIPCGQCIGCRLEYSREWANRGYLESKLYENNWFCTITYDEEHMKINELMETEDDFVYHNDGSWNGTLIPEDLTQFIKNVRQIMKREYNQDGIRFMACGEYGEQGERPHYHIIWFNLNLPLEDLYEPRIINNEVYYRSHIIERAWNKGISNISEATWNNIAYTARYITKKVNGKQSEEHYAAKGQEKEFFRVSRMPGIGQKYFEEHYEEIYKNDEIIIKNKQGSIATKPPKYFDRLYEQIEPKKFEKIKKNREKQARNSAKVKDQSTSLYRLAQFEVEERLKDEQTQKLIREFEKKTK